MSAFSLESLRWWPRRSTPRRWFVAAAALLILPPLIVLAVRIGGPPPLPAEAAIWNTCIGRMNSVDVDVWTLREPLTAHMGDRQSSLPDGSVLCAPMVQPEPAPGWTAVVCASCASAESVWVDDVDLARVGTAVAEPLWGLRTDARLSLRPPAAAHVADANPCVEQRRAAWWAGVPLYAELVDPFTAQPVGNAPYGALLCLTGQAPQPMLVQTAQPGLDPERIVDATHHPWLRVQTASGTYWTFNRALDYADVPAAPPDVGLVDGAVAAALAETGNWPRLVEHWIAIDASPAESALAWPDGRTAWYTAAAVGEGMESVALWVEWGFVEQPSADAARLSGLVTAVDMTDSGVRVTLRVAHAAPLAAP